MASTSSSQSATARLHAAFGKPLQYRCIDITKILDDTSTKELHTVLPLLLESIFGFNTQPGWGLNRISRSNPQDFIAIRQLLAPNGPLMTLIYKLLHDPYARYEFPVSCIPYPSRRTIEEGGIPPLYTDKVQIMQGVGRPYNMLVLNSFEFYFFHFAYFLVSPKTPKVSSWGNVSDMLYPVLIEDYLNALLPVTKTLNPIPHSPQPVRSPIQSSLQRGLIRPSSSGMNVTAAAGGSYNSILRAVSPTQRVQPAHYSAALTETLEQETWRSQTLLHILVEFWLHQTTLESEKYSLNQQLTPDLMGHAGSPGHPRQLDVYEYILSESFLPSGDHVRMVRMLVKHLHYFANSAQTIIPSQYSANMVNPMNEFKRMVLPQMLQKKLYAFLRHGFERWPLDSSFRLMLETWLSYIQPWRYMEPPKPSDRHKEPERGDKSIDDKWRGFITDNLLFYTVLFHDFVIRACRMDLCSPKNAYMIFRVTKVFNLPNVRDMLVDVEEALFEPVHSRSRMHMSQDLGASYLSPSNRAAILNIQFTELEGTHFQYRPMFSGEMFKKAYHLLEMMVRAHSSVAQNQQKNGGAGGGSAWNWLGLSSLPDYNATSLGGDIYDELGGADARKLPAHLEAAIKNLCDIFEMQPPEDTGRSVTWGSREQNGTGQGSFPDCTKITDHGPELSPLGRYQLANGLRKFEVEYTGDPETQPIRSYESAFLVRMLYQLSDFFNQTFSGNIESICENEKFMARVAAQFLKPATPVSTRPGAHLGSISPISYKQHESMTRPRLRLRWMASYHNLAYFIFLYLVARYILGLHPWMIFFIVLFLTFVYGALGVLRENTSKVKKT